jgi:hypothetical protein
LFRRATVFGSLGAVEAAGQDAILGALHVVQGVELVGEPGAIR